MSSAPTGLRRPRATFRKPREIAETETASAPAPTRWWPECNTRAADRQRARIPPTRRRWPRSGAPAIDPWGRKAPRCACKSFLHRGIKRALLICRFLSDLKVRPPTLPNMPTFLALGGRSFSSDIYEALQPGLQPLKPPFGEVHLPLQVSIWPGQASDFA